MPTFRRQARRFSDVPRTVGLDQPLVLSALGLVGIGIVMVASTSVAVAEIYSVSGWHFLVRHCLFIAFGLALTFGVFFIPSARLEWASRLCLAGALILLALPFVPGVGIEVNGATRWINLGVIRFQVVEGVKLLLIIYVAGYLARRPTLASGSLLEALKPLLVGGLVAAILLQQPDMGSAIVILAIIGGMVWLAGAAWKHLFVLGLSAVPLVTFAALEPYRLRRVMTFTDPWADPYNSGFQLVQALIAVGRGQISGVGLGSSVQKLYYLPEAHTDFIFAVLAEEFGLIGIIAVLGMFAVLVTRIFKIGLKAQSMQRPFAALVAWGIGLWVGLQALVAIGVNLGLLPTKGLTLPLIAAGGSSLLMTLLAVGMVLRIGWELDCAELARPRRRREWTP